MISSVTEETRKIRTFIVEENGDLRRIPSRFVRILAIVLGGLGRYRGAIAQFTEPVLTKPNYAKAYFNLGMEYLTIGDRNFLFRYSHN